jgi:hypothetical protein
MIGLISETRRSEPVTKIHPGPANQRECLHQCIARLGYVLSSEPKFSSEVAEIMRSPGPGIGASLGADHRVHPVLFENIKHCECLLIAPCSEHDGKETSQLPNSAEVT